jgi:Icc-related predicted phosphoesterase
MKIIRFTFFSFFILFTSIQAEINSQKNIDTIKNISDEIYSFAVIGHAYGAPSTSVYPSASLLSGVNKIKDYRPNFLILLGDTIQHGSSASNILNLKKNKVQKFNDAQLETLQKLFVDKINVPVLNVPGNHDDPEGEWYKYNFGNNSNINFKINSEAFILFNSMNLCGGNKEINLEEKFILENLQKYKNNTDIKNIFLLMHQAIFTSENNELKDVKYWVNGGLAKCPSYTDKILPVLNELQKKIKIFLIAGDTGCKDYKLGAAPIDTFPLFFHKRENINYLISGVCENINDNFVNIIINNGEVDFEPVSFLYDRMNNIEAYNLGYWKEHFLNWKQKQEKFETEHQIEIFKRDKPSNKIKKIIKLIEDMFKSKKFYAGIIFSFIILFFFKRFVLLFR